jgi:hypothetical protein
LCREQGPQRASRFGHALRQAPQRAAYHFSPQLGNTPAELRIGNSSCRGPLADAGDVGGIADGLAARKGEMQTECQYLRRCRRKDASGGELQGSLQWVIE